MRLSAFTITIFAAFAVTRTDAVAPTESNNPYLAYVAATARSLEQSRSPRDWALASQLLRERQIVDPGARHESAVLLHKAALAAPSDHLVQWLWADAAALASDCGTPLECAASSTALARLEPANAVAWLPVLDRARADHDAVAEENALARIATARHFDDHQGETLAAWDGVYKRFPLPSPEPKSAKTRPAMPVDSLSAPVLRALRSGAMARSTEGLFVSCNRSSNPNASASHVARCGAAGRLMMDQATFPGGRFSGFLVLRASGDARPADLPAMRAVTWQYEQFFGLLRTPDATYDRAVREGLASTGNDKALVTDRLRRAGLAPTPPATWQWAPRGKPEDMLHAPPGSP